MMKLVCNRCVTAIQNNPVCGKRVKKIWEVLSLTPVDFCVWENCHKCKIWRNTQRFRAKVT